jgi:hypothetical protein
MVAELLILAFVGILCLYWFRYNCGAILRTPGSEELARQVAAANHLRFPEVQKRLRNGSAPEELDALNGGLGRDYEILTCLLRYTSGFRAGSFSVDQRILMVDFKLLEAWYTLTRRYAWRLARRSLAERASILSYFANAMGKRSVTLSRA